MNIKAYQDLKAANDKMEKTVLRRVGKIFDETANKMNNLVINEIKRLAQIEILEDLKPKFRDEAYEQGDGLDEPTDWCIYSDDFDKWMNKEISKLKREKK